MSTALAIVLSLLASPMGATPSAMGAPHFLQLVSVRGLPADSSSREAFMTGFRGVFAEDRLASERRDSQDAWSAAPAFANRFRLLEGSPAGDAWTLDLAVSAPAPLTVTRRGGHGRADTHVQVRGMTRSRGMRISLTAVSPEAIRTGVHAVPQERSFSFPLPAVPEGASYTYTSSAFHYPWDEAGRIAGLLALEILHRGTGELRENERFSIAPAQRADSNP